MTSFTITVPTTLDAIDEGASELYDLTVGGVAATGTITDDDATPVDGNETNTVIEDTTLTVADGAPGDLLNNATDADGDTLTIAGYTIAGIGGTQIVGAPVVIAGVGTVTINDNGSYSFVPVANYDGAIPVITYTVTDGTNTDTSTLSLSMTPVNDDPVDGDETNTVTEDTPLTVTDGSADDLLANASDIDGGTLTVSGYTIAGIGGTQVVGAPVVIGGIGTITINDNGSYSFVPAANYTGAIPVITYTVSDGNGGTDTSTLTLTITPVNDAPITVADNATVVEGTTTAQASVLGNDSDPEGDAITVSTFATNTAGLNSLSANGTNTVTTALGGTVVVNADGTYTYTAPARDHSDATADVDTFAYRANDGSLDSPWTTVSITITDTAPIANDDVDSVGAGVPVSGNVITGAGGVTADTLNVDSTHNLTDVVLTTGSQISNTINGATNVRTIVTTRGTLDIDLDDGSYTYTLAIPPNVVVANPTGIASFTSAGVNLYGFDTQDPYVGGIGSDLDLSTLNATSAGRTRWRDNAGEDSDGVGVEQNPGTNNSDQIQSGEQLVMDLGVESKSVTLRITDHATGETSFYETYRADGTLVSAGSQVSAGNPVTLTISAGEPFSYVVLRSEANLFRLDGIDITPEPGSVDDVFTYTLSDSDGSTDTATLTLTYDSNTTANPDVATVYEAGIDANGAQSGGTAAATTTNIATGNLLANDAGITASTTISVAGATGPDVNGVLTLAMTGGVGTVEVYTQDVTIGSQTFSKGDYVATLTNSTTEGVNDGMTVNYTLTTGVDTTSSTLDITIVDDAPIAQDAIVQVQQGVLPDTNLVFVIDVSGSMSGEAKNIAADGSVTIIDRLAATKLAVAAVINEYFSQGGDVAIKLVSFQSTALLLNGGAAYTDAASAIAAVNALVAGGGTNYGDGLQKAMDAFTIDGAVDTSENNTVYFISDGVPTVGDITDPGASNGYHTFVDGNGINSYALGIGTGIANPVELDNIHNVDSDHSGSVDNAIIVTNVSSLEDVLLASVPTSFGGSVTGSTTNSSLTIGADGGYINTLVMSLDTTGDDIPDTDITFTYNGSNQITASAGFLGAATTAGSSITLNDANGFESGILTFDFDTGQYSYQTAGIAAEGDQFDINYTAIDGDGDTASGKQTVQIVDGQPQANNDADTLRDGEVAFEGNVISGIGTDGGDSVQLTTFSTGRSGEDDPGDGGVVTSIDFNGVSFDLTALVGTTAAAGGSYTVTSIGGVNTLTWTASSGGASLVFNQEGFYQYTPPAAEISTNVTGATANYLLTSNAGVANAAAAGMLLSGIARTSAAEGSAGITVSGNGVGVTGVVNTSVDRLESLVINFDSATHPHGVQNVILDMNANSNLVSWRAVGYSIYDVHGDLLGQFSSSSEAPLNMGFSGIGKIVIDSGGFSNPFAILEDVTFTTILDTAGSPAPAPEIIGYTITDTDGDVSSATLTLNNIIDDIAGTSASETINGTARNESISGFDGDDTINAGAGSDIVRGGDGDDIIDGGADNDQLYGNDGDDTITGGTGADLITGDAGNDTLSGNDGADIISGGLGNDTIDGGAGADTIIGGAGNDTLTGGAGVDVFKWELNDQATPGTPAVDVITDFDPAAVGGDVLDLRDLLIGEQHVTGVGNLESFLHFELVGSDTVIHVSDQGGFSGGYTPTSESQTITLTGVDLVSTLGDNQAIIQDLLTNNKLIVD
ncbi:MAG: Ig-like domain-containing protein [Methylophilaceae bacterium]